MTIHFVSFIGLAPGAEYEPKYLGNMQNLITRQKVLSDSALSKGNVDAVHLYNREKLVLTDYYLNNKELLDEPRGCGYWAWKPFVILQTLAKTKPNDYVIYCDVGKPNDFAKSDHGNVITTSLTPLVEWAERNDGMMPGVYLSNHGAAQNWIKRDCFILMGCDEPRFHTMPTIQAGYTVWKNTPKVINFLKQWQTSNLDARLISDQDNTLGKANYNGFQRNCHDQAVLTLLCEKNNINVFGSRRNQFLGFRNINFISHEAAYQNAEFDQLLILKKINKSSQIVPKYYERWLELLFQYRRTTVSNIALIGSVNNDQLSAWKEYLPNAKVTFIDTEQLAECLQCYDLVVAAELNEHHLVNPLLVNAYQALKPDGAFFVGPILNSSVKSEFEISARTVSSEGRFLDSLNFNVPESDIINPKISNSRNPIFVTGKSNDGTLESVCIMIKPSEQIKK